ncbi:MAG: Jag N-terminal domain-containing protein, partial [Parasporobacterium sp.]|nr:Jag N-terminal domain-containing protein [Parasporobacterium sp.]
MEFKEFTGKTVDDAITEALINLETTSDKIEYEVIEKGSSGLLGMFNKPAKIRARKKASMTDNVRKFIEDVLSSMGISAELDIKFDEIEKSLEINMEGPEMGLLIGKRGQTLDSLQYLVSLVANKESEDYIRVKLDTENYRERRKKTLENLAKNIAFKVKRTKRYVAL